MSLFYFLFYYYFFIQTSVFDGFVQTLKLTNNTDISAEVDRIYSAGKSYSFLCSGVNFFVKTYHFRRLAL